ncbi:M57 family metalloprotease [Lactiplantibacillus modestisalitolerans]|uniref:M57 family metalloprotease n=1 Tax=Lactiplantibacillus modestisalitolerans TaxID=1457219 RepID=A0ABV5WSJ8_9LACO|nr:M57 family metalloprotease [Lactiplantibacillus modestisalitolerans]
MKTIKRLLGACALVVAVVWGLNHQAVYLPKMMAVIDNGQTNLMTALAGDSSNQSQSNEQTTATDVSASGSSATATAKQDQQAKATAVESIVQSATLKKTYYYQFDDQLPAKAKRAFQTAIQTYNQTGIVNLVAGQAPSDGNSLTFSIYHKKMPAGTTQIELGHGGPEITKEVSVSQTRYWNQANASLNSAYSMSYSAAVAVHEVGHALGLDHSDDVTSVMYPVSQGRSQLSGADIAGLKSIYQS